MKLLLKLLFFLFLLWIIIGALLIVNEHPIGQLITGFSVLFLFFILMPLFIYYRYRGGNYKKYQLNDEKIKKWMRNK